VTPESPTGGGPIGRTRPGNPPNGNAPRPPGAVRVLMIGDMIGKPGRVAVEHVLPGLREERGIDFVTANGENVAGGMGLTASTANALLGAGVDVITSGNHIWDKREIYAYLETTDRVLRPLNYGPHLKDIDDIAIRSGEIAFFNIQAEGGQEPCDHRKF